MKFTVKVGVCLLSAALTAVFPAISHASPTGPSTSSGVPNATGTGQARVVMLITGDRVRVAAGGGMTVQAGKGRTDMTFVTRRDGKQALVIPTDALALINSGRLDQRLFDVNALLAFGYDERRKDLPLIVSYPDEARVKSATPFPGARVAAIVPTARAQSVRVSKSDGPAFWRGLTAGKAQPRALAGAVSKVWLDGLRKPTLDESVRQVGTPTAWRAGHFGVGVKVAVVDTGIDASHPDLADRVVATRNFTGNPDARDVVGHGTHVASTIAGSGELWNPQYRGVAPGVRLLDAKVCNPEGCSESAILAGMDWAAAQLRAKIVNISLGGQDTPEIDPVEQAVNALTAKYGTLFVVAAGNSGPMPGTVESPGSADAALTVGAVDKSNQLAEFSSRGPRLGGGAIKPDLTAPGVDITAARSKHGQHGNPGDRYTMLSGTSMAAPHVAGAAAILAGQHPSWTPAQLKSALMASANPRLAKPNPTMSVFKQGAGRLDLARAVTQTVTTAPASLNFGVQQWPHDNDTNVARIVRFRNHSSAAVSVSLGVTATWTDGTPAPAGTFRVDKTVLTIPARGTATATVTADTSAPGPDGTVSGYLTATSPRLQMHTPVTVNKEEETHTLTVVHTTRTGQPGTNFFTMLGRLDEQGDPSYDHGPPYSLHHQPGATVTLRVPKGRYILVSSIADATPDGLTLALTQLVQPIIDVSRDQPVAVDARLGKPIVVTVPRPQSTHMLTTLDFSTRRAGESYALTNGVVASGGSEMYSAQLGPDRPVRGESRVSSFWGDVNADGALTDKAHTYNLAWHVPDQTLTGFRRDVTQAELATVHNDYARHATGARGSSDVLAFAGDHGLPTSGYGWVFPLPFTMTAHYNAHPQVRWEASFGEFLCGEAECPVLLSETRAAPIDMRAGQVSHEHWNRAVFGPAFATPAPYAWVSRVDDRIVAGVPLFSDDDRRMGNSRLDSGNTTLYRNGTKLAQSPYAGHGDFTVPRGAARYRLEIRARRSAPFSFSTQVNVAWTFRSGHIDATTPVRLPLSVLRFKPQLSPDHTAPAGEPFTLPVTVQRQAGGAWGETSSLTVQVSYNGGRLWETAVVRPTGSDRDTWVAQLRHPETNSFVSLRATATDQAGNKVEQTIIHAYRLR